MPSGQLDLETNTRSAESDKSRTHDVWSCCHIILVVGQSVGIPKFFAVLMNFVEGLVALAAATGIEMPC